MVSEGVGGSSETSSAEDGSEMLLASAGDGDDPATQSAARALDAKARGELTDNYNTLKDKVRKFMVSTKGHGHPALSKEEFSLIVDYETARVSDIDPRVLDFVGNIAGVASNTGGVVHSPSDTFFREFRSTTFNIEGIGQAYAHHINYIGIGYMSAHYGLSNSQMNALINSWNVTQGTLTLSGRQFADIPESRRWAEYGRTNF